MTESEQFATEFLGVQPESFPIHINLKITGELLDAYLAHIEKKKADAILNVSNIEAEVKQAFNNFLVFGKSEVSITDNHTKVEHLTVEQIANKYPQISPNQMDEIKTPNVRILVWDHINNCYEPENKNK